MSGPYLVLAIVTALSTLPSAYFSGKEVRHADAAVRQVARYLMVRSVALIVVALVALVHQSNGWLAAVAVAMIVVQTSDAFLGAAQRRTLLVVGPGVTALTLAVTLVWLLTTQSV